MLNILICDDNETICAKIKNIAEEEMQRHYIKYKLSVFNSAAGMLEYVDPVQDYLFLLDIDMPGISGFDAAHSLQEMNLSDYIIFVTGHKQYEHNSFKFHPFYYLYKDRIGAELPQQLREFIEKYTNDCGLFELDNSSTIMIRDILYGVRNGHDVVLHTVNGDAYKTRTAISVIEKNYKIYGLVQTHRSYIINLKYLESIESSGVTLEDGMSIPVSVTRKKSFEKEYRIYRRRDR